MTAKAGRVAGVGGCRGGWLVALSDLQSRSCELRLCATFAEVLALADAPAIIAVDMPIGLPDQAGRGGRACDVDARSRLGERQSSVFSVPARAAIMETGYARACAAPLPAPIRRARSRSSASTCSRRSARSTL
jgi:predicted RNase H-like nuclease